MIGDDGGGRGSATASTSARAPRLLTTAAAALLVVGLSACGTSGSGGGSNAGQASSGGATATTTAPIVPSSAPATGTPVTQAQAQQIALAAAGPGATVRHVSPLHVERGQVVWTFEIVVGSQDRDISVAQATGQVIDEGTHRSVPATPVAVTQAQAEQIALATAGPGAVVLHVDGPHDELGQTVWTFEIAVGGQVRDISVAQASGLVVSDELHH